jgi:hypothetical protein
MPTTMGDIIATMIMIGIETKSLEMTPVEGSFLCRPGPPPQGSAASEMRREIWKKQAEWNGHSSVSSA